jgi:hypothetical protein
MVAHESGTFGFDEEWFADEPQEQAWFGAL